MRCKNKTLKMFRFNKSKKSEHQTKRRYDRCNNKIDETFYKEDEFVIYRANGTIRYEIFDTKNIGNNTNQSLYYRNKISEIHPILAEINHLQNSYPRGAFFFLFFWENRRHRRLEQTIADGLLVALKGDPEEESSKHLELSKEIFHLASTRLKQAIVIESKLNHLSGGFFLFLVLITLTALAIGYMNHSTDGNSLFLQLEQDSNAKTIYYNFFMSALLYGTIGGFMSIAINIKKLKIFPDLRPFRLGALRVFIASVSAVIVFLGIQSKMIFDIEIGYDTLPLFKIISFAAGFSEDILINLVSKLIKPTSD
ncbi:MAG: hypothetical protein AAF572_20690 [Cyanobacteria bacterium P01_B01_bin.77]